MRRTGTHFMLCATLASCLGAHAAGDSTSRIVAVTVDTAGATVQRQAAVAAGQKELRLECVSEGIDLQSLQLQPVGNVRLGEVKVQTLNKAQVPECADPALTQRIRELEDQVAQLDAQLTAQDYALGYLRPSGDAGKTAPLQAPTPAALQSLVDTVQRLSQGRLLEQHQLRRRKEQLLAQLQPLTQERERTTNTKAAYRRVTVQLAARGEGQVLISYRTAKAGWTPSYRAYLDTTSGAFSLERIAQVAQTSGEDWTGVALKLSTARPQAFGKLYPPQPWRLNIAPPLQKADAAPRAFAMAPAPKAARASIAAGQAEEELPVFDVSAANGEFSTEFTVPTAVDLRSAGQRSSFILGKESLPARLYVRVQADSGPLAHLVSVLPRAQGSWPNGPVELYRDGALVGSSALQQDAATEWELFWGPDEKLQVQRIPEERNQAQTGFIGARQEFQRTRRWVVRNTHSTAVELQLLESAPVAENAEIQVQRQYTPALSIASWRELPGIVGWQQRLEPGQAMNFEARYVISAPKDARIQGLP